VQGPSHDAAVLSPPLPSPPFQAEIAAVFNTWLPANSTYISKVAESKSMPMTTLLSMSTVASELRRAPRGANLDLLWQRLEQVKLRRA
jgi:hypothetical protein